MAIRPQAVYPGQVITGDLGYPHGKARNQTVVDDGTGTPWEEQLVNDIFGFEQALLAEAGATPSGTPDRVGGSQYLDALKKLIAIAQADVFALNWKSFATDNGVAIPSERLQLAVCQDSTNRLESWLMVKTVFTGRLYRTRDFFASRDLTSVLDNGSPVAITAIWGEVDRSGGTAINDLLVLNNTSVLFQTLDVGTTWSAGVALGSVCTALARSYPLGLVIVAGTGVVKTLSAALGSLTARTVPPSWAALTAGGIAVARGGESATAGAVIWPASAVTNVLHSADGVTWTNQSVGSGQVVSACWSEVHGKWFALTTLGLVYSSPNPSAVPWALIVTLVNTAGGPNFFSIRAFGRSIVIACSLGKAPYSAESGTIIVSQQPDVPSSYLTLSTGTGILGDTLPDNGETTLIHYDGQLVAGHVHTYSGPSYAPNFSVSMRAPWV